jgi:small-conductance mechanosensitive channel
MSVDWHELVRVVGDMLQVRFLELAGRPITLGTLLLSGLVLVAAYLASRVVRRGIDRWLGRSPVYTATSRLVAQKLAHYALMLMGLVAALQVLGIDLSTLFAAGAVFAVGLGFALQNVAQNFVSGVILLVERSIQPQDVLEVEGRVVRVEKMGIRSTIVRTRDEEELIIPNSSLVQSTVKNFTLTDHLYLLKAEVGVAYGSDLRQVRETLEAAARAVPWRIQEREPRVLLAEFGPSSVHYRVLVWIDDPWLSRRFLSDLNERIGWALQQTGITIAFPQLDLHLDRKVEEWLQRMAGGRVQDNRPG